MGKQYLRYATLIALLRSPAKALRVEEGDWTDIIVHARKAQVLGQLAVRLQEGGHSIRLPQSVLNHLELATLTATRRMESAMWEVGVIRRAVDSQVPLVLLKGCAYAAIKDANSYGRLFSDVDILVPRQDLNSMESALFRAGWKPNRVDDYDAAYYRNWMHEVPPMEHVRRHTVVDLHHAINPPVSRFYVDPSRLLERLVEVQPGVFVLGTADRVIHCCLHLLQEGEPKKLLRDLYDLHTLVSQHYGGSSGTEELFLRAGDLQVLDLVKTAVGAANALFGTDSSAIGGIALLQGCLTRCAQEANGADSSWPAAWSGTAVLAFSHWMKMPLHLLIPHLARKSFLRLVPERDNKS